MVLNILLFSNLNHKREAMNVIKLVDYSSSDEEKNNEATPTPIKFRGKRVFRRIIQSPFEATPTPIKFRENTVSRKIIQSPIEATPTPIKSRENTVSRRIIQTPIDENEQGIIKKKRWTKDESIRLKLALKASINPTTNEHWELICRSLGGKHTVDECKEQAKKFNWKPLEPHPEDEDDNANKKVQQELPILNGSSPWRRAVDNRKSRRSVECSNKFFNENVNDLTFNDLNLDDSLFTAAFSTPPEQAKCARRPFLIRVVADEDNEKSTTDDET